MELTPVFFKHSKAKTRYVISQGGTSAGKTWSILQLLYLRAVKYPGLHISIVAESLPVLKRGVIRDFIKMLKDEDAYDEKNHNKTDNIYNIGKSKIEFFSAEDSSKVRGARRDILFVNEANNINYDAFTEMEVRTTQQIFIDFNPLSLFWAHTKLMLLPESEFTFIKSTYKDNSMLNPHIARSIELKQNEPEWFKVYGLGEIGSSEGIIFNNWELCDEMPKDFQWCMYGIDWGFSVDPSTCIKVAMSEGCIWLDEILYEKGLTNLDLSNKINHLKGESFVADSAEPKSIEDLKRYGFNIKASIKGPDSIRRGIDAVKKYKMFVTKSSTNLIKELRNYQWKRTSNGDWSPTPIDSWNHLIDPLRYIMAERDNKGSGKFDYEFQFI